MILYLFIIAIIFLIIVFTENQSSENFLIGNCYQYPNDITGIYSINHLERGPDPYKGMINQSTKRYDCAKPKPNFSPLTYKTGDCCDLFDEEISLTEMECPSFIEYSEYPEYSKTPFSYYNNLKLSESDQLSNEEDSVMIS